FKLKPGEVEYFGFKLLDRAAVKDAAMRKNLVEALTKGMAEDKIRPAKCFNPRHGIHVVQRNGKDSVKVVDIVICFECSQLRVYTQSTQGKDKSEKRHNYLIGHGPEPAFDKAIKDLKLPPPPK